MNNEEKNIQAEQPEEVKKPTFADWWKKLATGAKAGIIAALSLIVIVPIVLVIALGGNGDNGGNGDGGSGDGDKSIVVTVVDEDGNAIKGVELRFIKGKTPLPKTTTDANGKATTTDKDVTKVKITDIPPGFIDSKLEEEQDIPADGKLTIVIEKIAPFVVRVVDQDGNAVVGAAIQVCKSGDNGSCVPLGTTDDNGVATRDGQVGDFEAKINSLPDGYIIEDDLYLSNYYPLVGNEVTIEVTKIAE